MGFLDRLAGIIGAETSSAKESAISAAHAKCAQRAAQLRRHAELAPQENAAVALRELADAEETQARRLRDSLASQRPSTAAASIPPAVDGSSNHWGRLVDDLEVHRSAVQEYRELAMRFDDSSPDLASLFETLCHEESAQCEGLRDLIARADPQALN